MFLQTDDSKEDDQDLPPGWEKHQGDYNTMVKK